MVLHVHHAENVSNESFVLFDKIASLKEEISWKFKASVCPRSNGKISFYMPTSHGLTVFSVRLN